MTDACSSVSERFELGGTSWGAVPSSIASAPRWCLFWTADRSNYGKALWDHRFISCSEHGYRLYPLFSVLCCTVYIDAIPLFMFRGMPLLSNACRGSIFQSWSSIGTDYTCSLKNVDERNLQRLIIIIIIIIIIIVIFCEGHAVAYWSRNYATIRKVAGSRPDEMNEFFQFT
jgi:hypothetical protein